MKRSFATQTTMALRTIPVILTNCFRKLKVSTLLQNASTQTYVNADVAAELGLTGTFEATNLMF